MIKLKNGIRLLFIKNNQKYVNVDFCYRVGNKDENKNQCGFAHLLEHLFFRSTKEKKYSDILIELEQYGSQVNACTKQEFTHFFMDCLVNSFNKSFDLFMDLITNDYYDDKEYINIIKIVNEEIKLYQKSPIEILKDSINKKVYKCGMKNSITDRQFVEIPNKKDIIDFKKRYYCSNNLIVTISGKMTYSIRKNVIDKLNSMKSNICFINDATLNYNKATSLPKAVVANNQIIIGQRFIYHTNSFDDFIKIKILSKLLGGSLTSRLFTSLREDRGMVYSVYSYSDMFINHVTLTIIAHMDSNNYKDVKSILNINISKKNLSKVSKCEFDKAKELLCLNFTQEFSSNKTLSQFVSECYKIYSLQLNFKKFIKYIKGITYDNFITFCKSLDYNWYNAIFQY